MNRQSGDTFIEPLTKREMDILNLLARGLSNQEIAEALVVEVGTVKWYNTQIYDKLQVRNRKQAVTRALTLGLLEAGEDRTAHRPLHNLPTHMLPFIGRAREISELVQQFTSDRYRLITILGPGGMGKTRLSIEIGRHLLGYFLDGVFFVPLAAATNSEQIVTAIAEVIGFRFHSDLHPQQQLFDHLQSRRMLLIIDNFEHLLDAAGLLADLLMAAPGVKVLATSRERLGLSGEFLYTIAGLSTPFTLGEDTAAHDAVQLFIEAASRTSAPIEKADLETVTRICQLLGGMPLAILLAAAWVNTLSLAEIEAEIQTGLGILEATLRDAPERHQSIEAVFDHSWRRLNPTEQTVFARLSVFREGFTREAAQEVAGAGIRELQHLVHASFLQHLPAGRYTIHELMRQYGENKLAYSGELEQVREKHARYFARLFSLLSEAGWQQFSRALLDRVSPDFENVRVAWQFYVKRQDFVMLRQVLEGIWLFLDATSRSREAIDLLEAVLPAIPDTGSDDIRLFRGQVVALLGWFYGDLGLKTKGLDLIEQALTILQLSGAADLLMLAQTSRAIYLTQANELSKGRAALITGLDLAREAGDHRWQNVFCHLLAFASFGAGQYEETLRWTEQIVGTAGLGLLDKGAALNQLGRYDEAHEILLSLLQINPPHRFIWTLTYGYLLENAVLRGECAEAWQYLQRGLHYVDDEAYAWAALDLLRFSPGLFIAEKQYELATVVLAVIAHHPAAMEFTRGQVARFHESLQALLSPEEFAAAWERGQQMGLGDLITELMER